MRKLILAVVFAVAALGLGSVAPAVHAGGHYPPVELTAR